MDDFTETRVRLPPESEPAPTQLGARLVTDPLVTSLVHGNTNVNACHRNDNHLHRHQAFHVASNIAGDFRPTSAVPEDDLMIGPPWWLCGN